jgi:putative addiction module component (TIGR02574 family)
VTTTDKSVFDAALALSREQRAELAERLLESLEPDDSITISEAWLREIERRLEDYRSGKAKTIPGEQVMAWLRRAQK